MMANHLITLIHSDLRRYKETFKLRGDTAHFGRIVIESFVFKPGFQTVFLYRLAHWLFQHGLHYSAWFFSRLNHFFTSAEIEYNAQIGPGLFIAHPAGIVVGRGVVLGYKTTLFQGVTLGASHWRPDAITAFPRLDDNVFVFSGAKIIGGIRVGKNVVIGANTVVVEDVPDGALVVGNPARIRPGRGAKMIQEWGLELIETSDSKPDDDHAEETKWKNKPSSTPNQNTACARKLSNSQ